MATYKEYEDSPRGARPLECYLFKGTFREYAYTSADVPVTLVGRTYQPVPIKRGAIKTGTQADDGLDMELRLPFDVALVKDYAYAISPPHLEVTVYRVHREMDLTQEPPIYWSGNVSGFNVEGREARIKVPSVFTGLLASAIPSVYYHQPCNHVLYDSRCKVSREANRRELLVAEFEGVVIQYNEQDPPLPADFFKGGELLTQAGERRTIVNHNTALSQLQVNYPFARLERGMGITLVRGCNHLFDHPEGCSKFMNHLNFGGFPFIPRDNPFEGSIA